MDIKIYENIPFFNQDKWHIRDFKHKRNNNSKENTIIDFTTIPKIFVVISKIYAFSCLQRYTFSTVKHKINCLSVFLEYISSVEENWNNTLELLDINHILSFMDYLEDKNKKYIYKNRKIIGQLVSFAEHMQSHYPMLISNIDLREITLGYQRRFLNEDVRYEKIKHIPEEIVVLWDQKINTMENKQDLLICKIMRETGLRCSNIFNLKYDKCLLKEEDGYYLRVNQISKVGILDKRIPIKLELAIMLQDAVLEVSKITTNKINKEHYLLVKLKGKDIGKRLNQNTFINRLNNWASSNKIVCGNGESFNFRYHAFRHNIGRELINSECMDIEVISDMFAHRNKDMTMEYALIEDRVLLTHLRHVYDEVVELNSNIVKEEHIQNLANIMTLTRKRLGICARPTQVKCILERNICTECVDLIKNK